MVSECLTLFYFCGLTALHMAAANGHLDIVEYLISKGVVRHPSYNVSFLSLLDNNS